MSRRDLRDLTRAACPESGAGPLAPGLATSWRAALDESVLGGREAELAGKCVLIGVSTQFAAARVLMALDGVAERIVIAPPDFTTERLASATA